MQHTKKQPFFARFLESQDLATANGGDPGNSGGHSRASNKNHLDEPESFTKKYPSDSEDGDPGYVTLKYPSDSEDS